MRRAGATRACSPILRPRNGRSSGGWSSGSEATSMFRREQHRKALALLRACDSEKSSRCRFLFGGGTRIVLDLQAYREPHDVDFLCADAEGYAELRFEASRKGY